jgi:hypothetical protein
MSHSDWERGNLLGENFPVHFDALVAAGPSFLTKAFRSAGSITADNSVTAITQLESFAGGSTGRKALLSVTYEHPAPQLPESLFVKFSRDLDDEIRDRGKVQMESEARFGLLSQIPDFPVAVPRCLFGEYQPLSGSGILISERIAFGTNGIEPHHLKARDYEIEDPRGHYDALVSALARLAGSHRAGRFPEEVMAHFATRDTNVVPRRRNSYSGSDVRDRVTRYAQFAARAPQLLPESLRTGAFLAQLFAEAPRAVENADALRSVMRVEARNLSAFCHWNANIDNAWFWRDEYGALACGLMDWGNVGQVNMVTALASCLVFAEPNFVIENLGHFFRLFSEIFEEAGGGRLDPEVLALHFRLQMVAGGLQWPLNAVPLLERQIPDLDSVCDRFDPPIMNDEFRRTQLHMLTAYLTFWRASDPENLINWAIRAAG